MHCHFLFLDSPLFASSILEDSFLTRADSVRGSLAPPPPSPPESPCHLASCFIFTPKNKETTQLEKKNHQPFQQQKQHLNIS